MKIEGLGNSRVRVYGPEFFADVDCSHQPCVVVYCNNPNIDLEELSVWCERNIQ